MTVSNQLVLAEHRANTIHNPATYGMKVLFKQDYLFLQNEKQLSLNKNRRHTEHGWEEGRGGEIQYFHYLWLSTYLKPQSRHHQHLDVSENQSLKCQSPNFDDTNSEICGPKK